MIGEGEKNIKRNKQTRRTRSGKKLSSFFVYSVDQSNKNTKTPNQQTARHNSIRHLLAKAFNQTR
jgi:hypothetical protein